MMNRRDFLNIGFLGILAVLFGVSLAPKSGIRHVGFYRRFKVYKDPYYTVGDKVPVLVGYKGNVRYMNESPIIFAPYVPLDL